MNKAMKKIRGGSGFTLVEMLIVVAIIAILIAISIPLVNNALERAKHATDAANERAAKAEIMIQYLADGGTSITPGTVVYCYDAAEGSIKDATTDIIKYGKHKTAHEILAIKIKSADDPVVLMKWIKTTDNLSSVDFSSGVDLCSAKNVDHT